MPSLADLMEDYRNWRGRQEWESGKGWQDFYNGDPVAQERFEKMSGFGTGTHGVAPGIAGTFAGLKSLTADRVAWNKAQLAEKLGKPVESTWYEHNWGKAPWDEQWRYEIPDEASKFTKEIESAKDLLGQYDLLSFMSGKGKTNKLSDIFEHKDLYEAYPDLKNIKVGELPEDAAYRGMYSKEGSDEYINLKPSLTAEQARSTLLHELQHAVQEREGFGRGTSVEEIQSALPEGTDINDAQILQTLIKRGSANPALDFEKLMGRFPAEAADYFTQYTNLHALTPKEAYKRAGGEAEARLTQKRMDYSMPGQRRLLYPFSWGGGLDVPLEEIYNIKPNAKSVSLSDLLRR